MKDNVKKVISQVLCVIMIALTMLNTTLVERVDAAPKSWKFSCAEDVQTYNVPYTGTYYVKVLDDYNENNYVSCICEGKTVEGYVSLKAGSTVYISAVSKWNNGKGKKKNKIKTNNGVGYGSYQSKFCKGVENSDNDYAVIYYVGDGATSSTAPSAPSNLAYNVGNNSVTLTWAAVNTAAEYYVYRNSTKIATISTNSYIDYLAPTGMANTYFVIAHNSQGISGASAVITVPAQSAPTAPTNLAYNITNSGVSLTWTAASGAVDYYVFRNSTQIATVNANSYIDHSASNGANVYYVKAHNSQGTSGVSNIVVASYNSSVTQPAVSPITGVYTQPVSVYLYTTGTSTGTIRYTTDGSEPTEYSTIYTNPIYVDKTTIVKAKTFINGSGSSTAVVVYTIQNSDVDKEALLAKAKQQYNSGDYDGAIGTLNQLLALDKDNEDGILLYADCYVKKNDLNTAKNKLKEFIYVYEYPRVVNRYAQVCIKRGEYQEARQVLIDILRKYPNESYLYQTLADAYEKLNITGIRVFAFGKEVDFVNYDNIRPYLSEGRTLIPIRALAEALGARVNWNPTLQKATIYYNGKTLEITNGLRVAKINGVTTTLDVAAQMNGDRLMVPLRFVSENFDKMVDWYSVESVVNIISITDQE